MKYTETEIKYISDINGRNFTESRKKKQFTKLKHKISPNMESGKKISNIRSETQHLRRILFVKCRLLSKCIGDDVNTIVCRHFMLVTC